MKDYIKDAAPTTKELKLKHTLMGLSGQDFSFTLAAFCLISVLYDSFHFCEKIFRERGKEIIKLGRVGRRDDLEEV